MLVLVGLPPLVAPLLSVLVALIVALAQLRDQRQHPRLYAPHDPDVEIRKLTNKVRRKARLKSRLGL